VVSHQKESACQATFGDPSGVPNPDDSAVAKLAQTAKLVEQARHGPWIQVSKKQLHRAVCVVS
jgi:hypothetical protein